MLRNTITVPARIVPAATIKGFEFFGAGSIRVATLQILLTKNSKYRGTLHKPSPLGSKENDEITGVTTY